MMRAGSTCWFDLLAPKDDMMAVLEALAATQAVQLEAGVPAAAGKLDFPPLIQELDAFSAMARHCRAFWPEPDHGRPSHAEQPQVEIIQAMAQIRGWADQAERIILKLQATEREAVELELLRQLLEDAGDQLPRPHLLGLRGSVVQTRLFLISDDCWPETIAAGVVVRRIVTRADTFLFAVGPVSDMETLDSEMASIKARLIPPPPWLPSSRERAAAAIDARLAELAAAGQDAADELAELNGEFALSSALAIMERLRWFVTHARETGVTGHFVWLTGWTDDPDGGRLHAALASVGVNYVLRHSPAPEGREPPIILKNPAWVRPFEIFVRMFGMPSAHEADASPILAVVTPLMFGFMFADVGQGLVLLLAGLFLRRKWPGLAVLVPGGALSMGFGFLFGSVFSREDIVPALWLHPLETPVTLLVIALIAGVFILLAGVFLDALQYHWRRADLLWWSTSAGRAAAFFGCLAALANPSALWLTASGALWFVTGSLLLEPGEMSLARLGSIVGRLVETSYQLIINTLSFARIGAFAIAHAGLSAAIVGIAGIAESEWGVLAVMILGNAIVICLEGLVVGIQTTRLILFEFFFRFFKAEGRKFHPLSRPDFSMLQFQGSAS